MVTRFLTLSLVEKPQSQRLSRKRRPALPTNQRGWQTESSRDGWGVPSPRGQKVTALVTSVVPVHQASAIGVDGYRPFSSLGRTGEQGVHSACQAGPQVQLTEHAVEAGDCCPSSLGQGFSTTALFTFQTTWPA